MSDEPTPEERRWADLFRQERAPAGTRRWESASLDGASARRSSWLRRLLLAPVSAGGERRLRPLAAALVLPLLVLAAGGGLQLRAHFTGSSGSGTPGNPPARDSASMAFDAARGVVVMFGGRDSNGGAVMGDTWTWDGSSWSQQHPAHSPSPRSEAPMAFDTVHGVVVMYGGLGAPADGHLSLQDTWTWDGSDWRQVKTAHSPGARSGQMAYDANSNELLLVTTGVESPVPMPALEAHPVPGQIAPAVPLHPVTPPASPPAAVSGAGASNAGSMAGAISGTLVETAPPQISVTPARPPGSTVQTWAWTGSDWQHLAPKTVPAGAFGPEALAWDAAMQNLLLLEEGPGVACAYATAGGPAHPVAEPQLTASASPPPGKAGWTGYSPLPQPSKNPSGTIGTAPLPPATVIAPPASPGCADVPGVAQRCVRCVNPTQWAWNGSDWRTVNQLGPVPSGVQVVPDPTSGHPLAVGSVSTWTWNGSRWSAHRNPAGMSPRFLFMLAADTARNDVVLFGGRRAGDTSDTWTWDGKAWTHRAGPIPPPPPTPQAMFFGGTGGSTGSTQSCQRSMPPYTMTAASDGSVLISVGQPASKLQCTGFPALSVHLRDSTGTDLTVAGNGVTLQNPVPTQLVWSNWCGAQGGGIFLVASDRGEGGSLTAYPTCTDRSKPSVLKVLSTHGGATP